MRGIETIASPVTPGEWILCRKKVMATHYRRLYEKIPISPGSPER